jgi:hypothetical protein
MSPPNCPQFIFGQGHLSQLCGRHGDFVRAAVSRTCPTYRRSRWPAGRADPSQVLGSGGPDHRRSEESAEAAAYGSPLLGITAAAWPLAARAQQTGKLPTIGFLVPGTPLSHGPWFAALLQRLRELGWIEGRTVAIEYRWAEGHNERYAEFAAEFVQLKVFFRGTFDPAFMLESSMLSRKFHVGQLVQLAPTISRNVPGGSYEITKKLPESRGEFEYRIKSMNEPHERVVRESELRGV